MISVWGERKRKVHVADERTMKRYPPPETKTVYLKIKVIFGNRKNIQWTLIEKLNEAFLLLLSLQINFKNTLSQGGNWYSIQNFFIHLLSAFSHHVCNFYSLCYEQLLITFMREIIITTLCYGRAKERTSCKGHVAPRMSQTEGN